MKVPWTNRSFHSGCDGSRAVKTRSGSTPDFLECPWTALIQYVFPGLSRPLAWLTLAWFCSSKVRARCTASSVARVTSLIRSCLCSRVPSFQSTMISNLNLSFNSIARKSPSSSAPRFIICLSLRISSIEHQPPWSGRTNLKLNPWRTKFVILFENNSNCLFSILLIAWSTYPLLCLRSNRSTSVSPGSNSRGPRRSPFCQDGPLPLGLSSVLPAASSPKLLR